eukprot:352223-Chlamydomonas_euryale.AAC.24
MDLHMVAQRRTRQQCQRRNKAAYCAFPHPCACMHRRYTLSDHYTVCAEDTAVLRSLTLLRSLTVHCWLTPTFSETLLSSLSALTGLEALELDGISIPPDDNRVPGLGGLTELT